VEPQIRSATLEDDKKERVIVGKEAVAEPRHFSALTWRVWLNLAQDAVLGTSTDMIKSLRN
jgi:hypothetical protein